MKIGEIKFESSIINELSNFELLEINGGSEFSNWVFYQLGRFVRAYKEAHDLNPDFYYHL